MNQKSISLTLFKVTKHIFLLVLLSCATASHADAQNDFSQMDTITLFDKSKDIINGQEWVYTKKYVGHPFFQDNEWMKSDIVYKGILFNNENVKYNINTDELIVFRELNGQARIFTLNKQYLQSFTLFDKTQNQTLLFEYDTLLTTPKKSIFSKVYSGKTNYYIQYQKEINKVVSAKYTGEYLFKPRLYILQNNTTRQFETKSQFLAIMGNHKSAIKKYMRTNRIKFDRKFPEKLIPVFEYYDSLLK